MSLYATTVIPSLDGVGGVDTLQRLVNDATLISHAIYDEESHSTVAILKTTGGDVGIRNLRETLNRFDVPLITSHSLLDAISKAKKFAHDKELVDVADYHLLDSYGA